MHDSRCRVRMAAEKEMPNFVRGHMAQQTCNVRPIAFVQLLHRLVKQVGIAPASVLPLKRNPHRFSFQAEGLSHDPQMQMFRKDSFPAGSRSFLDSRWDSAVQPSHL